MDTTNRKRREQEFHDQRFGADKDPRQSLGTAYRLMLAANLRYHKTIEEYGHRGRVLEYGCGQGENALTFARRGIAVNGIDLSPMGVAHARAEAVKVGLGTTFQVMDAENLAFAANTFDVVCGKGILHHLDLTKALAEIGRVLTPQGRAVFIEPLGSNPLINWYRRRTPQARTPDETPLLPADLDKVRSSFGHAEFTFYNLSTLLAVPIPSGKTFDRVLGWCDRFDAWLFQTLPWLTRHAWMVLMDLRHPVIRS